MFILKLICLINRAIRSPPVSGIPISLWPGNTGHFFACRQGIVSACLAATAISRNAVFQVAPASSHGVRSSTRSIRLSHIYAATCSITASSSLLVQSLHRLAISNPCKFVPVAFHKRMHRQTRITVDLAVQILRDTLAETSNGRVDTVPVRLALRCLWTHCPERWPLVMFWEGAQQDNQIGRSQSVTASFNGIIRQLRRSGAYSETST